MMWLIHNCIAHPIMGLFPHSALAAWFHDVTAPCADPSETTETTT